MPGSEDANQNNQKREKKFIDIRDELVSSGDVEADLIATLIVKSDNNISGVLDLMQNFPLSKVRSIMSFWQELTMPMEDREKRMRKEADKAAQEFHEKLFSGKIEKTGLEKEFKEQQQNSSKSEINKEKNADPELLSRFLDFTEGLDPSMFASPKQPQQKEKENGKN